MRTLPDGELTLLFTDIDGSTRLVQKYGDRYPDAKRGLGIAGGQRRTDGGADVRELLVLLAVGRYELGEPDAGERLFNVAARLLRASGDRRDVRTVRDPAAYSGRRTSVHCCPSNPNESRKRPTRKGGQLFET